MTAVRTFGKGHWTTPTAQRMRFGAPHPTVGAFSFPPSYALRSCLPATFNQKLTSTCFAHAQASLIYLSFVATGRPLPWVPSPLGIARCTYAEEQPGGGRLDDVGASMGDVMTAIAREGIRPLGPLIPGAYTDVSAESVALRPTLLEDEQSARELVLGPQQLQPTAPDFQQQTASSLANMRCGVSIGLHSTPAFEAWFMTPPRAADGSFVALTDATGATTKDGHDVALADYRTEADGTLSFWVRSSWGEGGDDGGIWVAGTCLAQLTLEAWRMKVSAAGA